MVFPQFGAPLSTMSQHGFARNTVWSFLSSECNEEFGSIVFSLSASASTKTVWPHDFHLLYKVTLTKISLVTELSVKNTTIADTVFEGNDCSFTCHTLLHTYVKIDDIRMLRVEGMRYYYLQ